MSGSELLQAALDIALEAQNRSGARHKVMVMLLHALSYATDANFAGDSNISAAFDAVPRDHTCDLCPIHKTLERYLYGPDMPYISSSSDENECLCDKPGGISCNCSSE